MDNEIIYDEEPLKELYIPTRLWHREGELRELERCLKPVLRGRSPDNVFLVGPTGTGKTVLTRWILKEYFQTRSAYINCWKCRTTYEVLKQILLSFGIPVHGREPRSDMIRRLESLLEKRKIIICLDEVDQLKDSDILYILARGGYGLILISNDYYALMHLDSRIRSSLALTEIEFPAYRPDELFDILKDRARYSFKPGTLPIDLVRQAAAIARGDARIGLKTLCRAGHLAENSGLKRVTMDEVRQASKEAKKFKKSYLLSKLNDHQRVIYEILERRRKVFSGQLYEEYCKTVKKPVVARAYRKWMEKMIRLGLAKGEGKKRWRSYEIVI